MARHRLRDTQVRALAKPGVYGDGDGLYLRMTSSGSKSWIFIWQKNGRRREMGLGGYKYVSLSMAREKAEGIRELIGRGLDPLAEKRAAAARPTFGQCADEMLDSMESQWRNDKHKAQWRMTLTTYAGPLHEIPVEDVTTDDVVACLKPIWETKSETASRTRGRIEKVLDHAKARGLRDEENPARWKGHLDHILPARQRLSRGNHVAMPYAQIPEFMGRLREMDSLGARALEFTILAAARTGEVLGARWDEVDWNEAAWTVPAERMKAGRVHKVPLSGRAVDVLRALHEIRTGDYVFPGAKSGRPLSNMAMAAVLKRMDVKCTVHGFRSTFRDWVAEKTDVQNHVAEAALAHVIGNRVEAAYRRGDLFEKRRDLMVAWEMYCLG